MTYNNDQPARNTAFTLVEDFSKEELTEAFLQHNSGNHAVEELIATTESVFTFIRNSDMDDEKKNAFWQLEKQFLFYKNLVLLK
jgi:hypothetical protein